MEEVFVLDPSPSYEIFFSKLLALHSNGIFIKINTHPGSIVFGGL